MRKLLARIKAAAFPARPVPLALLALFALCATGGAWADTLRVLGDDVAIHSTSASGNLNRSGYAITTGTLSFNTPAGCSAGDPLLFTKLQMVNEGTQNNYTYAQTITITVGDNTYTSGTVVGPATESIGNAGSKSVLTYNFPNVPVQAGSSYSITFNDAGSAGIRYGVENTNNCTGYTISLTGSSDNWHPYGAITATKVLSSSPDVGDTILLSNTATSGTVSDAGAGEGNLSLTIPSNLGIPANSVVRIKKVNLAGWNNSFTDWDNTNHKSDPYFIKINNIKSLSLQGTTSDPGSAPSINLQTAKIQGNATTSLNRLSFEYSVDCDLTVGTTYPAATGNNASTGVALLYRNGNLCYGGGRDQTGVRYVTADSASVLSSAAASGAYPIYEMYAEVISIPTETATIPAAGTYTLAGLFASVSDSGRYTINVNESATLNIDAATTVASLTFNVASGKTLTVTGSALTVDGGLHVTGDGYVNLTSATVSGTLKGDGTVVYTGTATPSGLVFTDNAWEGTLWLENKTGVTAWEPTSYGSANSTIRMTGIQLYFNTSAHQSSNVSFDGTLEVTDTYSDGTAASYGIEINNGWSSATTTFGALKGTGTIQDTDQSATPLLAFNDASEFEGTINLSYNKKIRIGTSGDDVYAGEVYIASGKAVTVATGTTWTSRGGFYVRGTLTLGGTGSTLSGPVKGSGTVVCNQVDLSGSGFDTSANDGWRGKVQIAGDNTIVPTTSFDEASYGNASSTLEVTSGSVAITTATSLPGTVNVASGATLYMTSSSITSLAISGTNSGSINLSGTGNLTTLTLSDGIASGTVYYPSSLTTLNVSLTETIAHDGEYSFTCAHSALETATLTLTRPDGTIENVTGTIEGSTVSFEWTPAVSGKACWVDYEMDYVSGSKNGFESTGADTTELNPDSGISGDNAFYNGMLYTYAHPWRDMTGDNAYPSSWTAVVRCTVPAYENAAIITFGTLSGGLIGLVAGADPETQMKLVKTTGNSAFTVLSTMTVQNATTAQHVYVFEVENNSTIKVYCDGDEVLNETYSAFMLGGGIQIGSVHGGVGNTGIVRFAKNENPANTLSETVQKNARIDCVRLYKGLLGPNAIRQLSVEFPAVKLYRATVAANATTDWDSLSWTPSWDDGNLESKIILTVEGDATLTLPSTIIAEDFKIEVASGHVLTLNRPAGGTTITTTNPMEIDDGTMYLADDSSLGTWEIAGTGTVRLKNGAMVTGALSGTAKIEIPSGSSVVVMGGSIANTITGSGALGFITALPASPLSFDGWTGTVALNQAIADGAINFNDYGCSGSKIQLAGMSGGYLVSAEVLPEVELIGGMTLPYFSASFVNTIDKLSGVGAFSLTADGTAQEYANGYFLIKDVSDFTGSITVAAPGLALGGSSKPSSTTWYGKIVVQAPVTVGSSATWSASGVVLAATDATLTVPSGATVPSVASGVENYYVWSSTSGDNTVYGLVADDDAQSAGTYTYDGESVSVDRGWAAKYGATSSSSLATVLAGIADNGLTYFECYALGLDPEDDADKPVAIVTTNASGEFVITLQHADGTAIVPPSGVALTLTVKYGTSVNSLNATTEADDGTSGATSTFTINPVSAVSVDSVKYYRVSVAIGSDS